jgi:ABC-type antimicrobial peptide transport system permease subunit
MKHFYAALVSLAVMFIATVITQLLKVRLDLDFLVGWLSCMGYFITLNYLSNKEKEGDNG